MREPIWKTVLNWGAVMTFFMLPLSVFIVQLAVFPDLATQKADLDYLKTFMTNITFLVFGLAGLRTWEVIKQNGVKANADKEWKPGEPPKSLESKV